jgi:predicted transcriptional regulator
MTKLVKDLMHKGLITCKPGATLGEVAGLLNRYRVHALVVADDNGDPLGIISDFDLLAGEWLSSDAKSFNTMRTLTASDLMSHPVDSVETNIALADAVHIFINKDISRLLVTEQGKAVGVISISDFVASIAGSQNTKRGNPTVSDLRPETLVEQKSRER